jgi:hypothetical protein
MTKEEPLLDILKYRIISLEESIKSWKKGVTRGLEAAIYNKYNASYFEGVIDQAQDEIDYLNRVIMEYEE